MIMAMATSLFFSLLSLLLLIFSLAESRSFLADVDALKEFKNSVDPNSVSPGSCLSSWDFSVDPCDSLFGEKFTCGFRCDVAVSGSGRITEISLDQAGYSGSLSSASFNLPYLRTLDLTGNSFSGPLPDSLSNLTRLTRLALSRNSLSGFIPGSIGSISGLQELLLDNNKFEGPVPASFNGLSGLNRLEIQFNNISGELPDLGKLKSLDYLDASNNGICGGVPSSLPESLIQISMRNNMIEGTIPESLKRLSSLQVLDLSHNKLSGSVPITILTHPSLQQLTLSFNRFTSVQSPIYSPLGVQSELIAVDLSNNEIQGLLPLFLGLMLKLSALSLENNKFSGMIPTQYAWKTVLPGSEFAPFQRLILSGNYLFGPIPGPLMGLKPGSANVQLAGNCLLRCPVTFFFCQGGEQRPLMECREFGPVIP